jgi:predicted 3-demethylubiquinone-9 3-methyltransferase (glyoxalase superfamily)
MNKITPFLWFNGNIKEALDLYTSVFKNSKIISTSKMGVEKIFSATFELEGQTLMALDGGPHYHFTPAISLYVDCKDQEEVDTLWSRLIADGGKESRCGWLVDKFGLSWQIIPSRLIELLYHKDAAKAKRAMDAMMTMNRIIIADLEKAAEGE